jgi:hypothetical protein
LQTLKNFFNFIALMVFILLQKKIDRREDKNNLLIKKN